MKFGGVALYKPKGGKTYCFKIPAWVKPTKRHFNTHQANKEEAVKIRDDYLAQMQSQAQGLVFNDACLDKVIEAYLVAKGYLAKRSIVSYKATVFEFRDFVISKLGRMPKIQEIDKTLCEGYLQGLSDKGLNPHTRNDRRNIIANLFNYAVDSNWLHKSPLKKIKKVPEPESEHPDPLQSYWVNKILNYLKKMKRSAAFQIKCYFEITALVYYAGLRVSEGIHLLKDDLEFNLYRIKVHGKMINREEYRTKTKRIWYAPINKELELILRNWLSDTKDDPSPLLFPNSNGNPIKYDHILNTIKKAMRQLGFPPEIVAEPFRRGRHTFTSNARQQGVEESIVQQALGHKSNIMTRHYTHLSPQHIRNKFNKVSYGQNKRARYNK